MKKITLFLVAAILLSLFATPAFAANTRLIEGFDDFKDEASYDSRVFVWQNGGDFNLSLSNKRADEGKSLRVIPDGTGVSDFGVINLKVPDHLQNWEDAEGLRFWAEATGGTVMDPTYIGIEVAFDDSHLEGKPERFIGYKQRPYTVIFADGSSEVRRFGDDGRVVLDDGFKGWVEIPFSSFECAGWSMQDDELHLDKVTTIFFGTDCGFHKSKEVYIDSVMLYGKNVKDVTPAPTDKPDPTATPEPTNTPEPTEDPTTDPTTTPDPEETVSPEPTESVEPTESPNSTEEPAPTDEDTEPVDGPSGGGNQLYVILGVVLVLAAAGAATYFLVIRGKKQ